MSRIRINFGNDFCGEIECNICFRDADSAEAKADEQLQKELDSYNSYRDKLLERRKIEFVTNKFKVDTTKAVTLDQIKCPRCNGSMVVRTNRNTQQKFLGCRIFPDCRGTRELPAGLKEKTVLPVSKPVMPSLALENEATIKGKLKVLQKEEPKPKPIEVPVKEISFEDLLARPASLANEVIKTEGTWDFVTEYLDSKQESKEKK